MLGRKVLKPQRPSMLAQFIPLYCALVCGSMAAAVGAVCMSLKLHAQTVRVRKPRPLTLD